MKFNVIENKRVYEKIIDQIKEMIYQKELKKGDKLPSERTLVKDLNVSRASIREAFSALEMIGLVESRHGEGTFIKENTNTNFLEPLSLIFMLEENVEQELIEVRRFIEISGVRKVARVAKKENLDEIELYLDLLEKNRGDAQISKNADRGFHYALAKATNNTLLFKLLNSISELIDIQLSNVIEKIVNDKNKNEILIYQHKSIYREIFRHDSKAAAKAMEIHLDWAEELLDI